ncbi:MAG: Beta-galactosidase C-terminal domain, partial [Clostridiales bacterium]|nr:Beta-galactosidase C-terminal domain [Clostridiales bacterium]
KDDFYAGSPAVTVNNYGKGKAYYIAFRDCGDFLDKFYGDIVDELGLTREIGDMPYGVTAHTRESDTDIYTFVQNYTTEPCDVTLSNVYTDVLSGETVSEKITLPKYGVKVLKRSK